MRAPILDGEDLATAIDDADLEIVVLHEALFPGGKLVERADVDQRTHVIPIPEVGILSGAGPPAGRRGSVRPDGAQTIGWSDDVRGPQSRADEAPARGRAAAARDGARDAIRARAGAGGRGADRAFPAGCRSRPGVARVAAGGVLERRPGPRSRRLRGR